MKAPLETYYQLTSRACVRKHIRLVHGRAVVDRLWWGQVLRSITETIEDTSHRLEEGKSEWKVFLHMVRRLGSYTYRIPGNIARIRKVRRLRNQLQREIQHLEEELMKLPYRERSDNLSSPADLLKCEVSDRLQQLIDSFGHVKGA